MHNIVEKRSLSIPMFPKEYIIDLILSVNFDGVP